MARQRDVIEPREFESQTVLRQWYRTIGMHRYRFRSTDSPSRFDVTAEMAVANREWELVHQFLHFKKGAK